MSARPAPRRSALAGLSAAQPSAPAESVAPVPVAPETAAEAPQAPPAPARTPARTTKATKAGKGATAPAAGATAPATSAGDEPAGKSKKVGIYQDPELTARARAAYRNTALMQGYRSFSDFAAEAFAEKIEALEAQYNDGKPWPALAPGVIPTGRPMGE